MPFKQGQKKQGGRQKGSVNKFTSLKDSFLDAFENTGGTKGLEEWIEENKRNRAQFYQLITKMLPANLNLEGGIKLTHQLSEKFMPKDAPKETKKK